MNVIVCVKQVPGTNEVKMNKETNTIIREGVEAIINPYDTYAVEEGLPYQTLMSSVLHKFITGRLVDKQAG